MHTYISTHLQICDNFHLKNKGGVRLDTCTSWQTKNPWVKQSSSNNLLQGSLVEPFWFFLLNTTLLPIHQHPTTANSVPDSSSKWIGTAVGWQGKGFLLASMQKKMVIWKKFGHPYFVAPFFWQVESGGMWTWTSLDAWMKFVGRKFRGF